MPSREEPFQSTTTELDDAPYDHGRRDDDGSFRRAQQRSAALEQELRANPGAHRVLSGDRPTGELHLGHLLGTLANRVALQRLGVPLVLVIADYQVITDRESVGPLRERVRSLVADYLAVGVDPERTVIFPHSAVPALNQLLVPFLSLVTDAELHRNPTVKAETASAGRPLGGLLLTYPVHQAADILFCGGTVVPVGRDQLPHLELARSIARRFNERYGEIFRVPEALLSSTPLVLGTDGQKMSKSRANTISISADEDTTARRIRISKTDSVREIRYAPDERPEVASLLAIIGALTDRSPAHVAEEIGDRGSGALKALAIEVVNETLAPVRARRRQLIADPGYLDGVLVDGIAEANAMANATLQRVRAAMRMDYLTA
jgi:tryptophanyl-tRNA synthetase